MSHLEDCVLRRLNPLEIASSVGCVTYTKCPQPRIKRDGLRRTGGKGNRKYHVDLPTHLEHRCASHYLKVHCVIFRMIYRQKCNIIYITTFSEEYKDLT